MMDGIVDLRCFKNERNATPYIFKRDEYYSFWNSMLYYQNGYRAKPRGPHSVWNRVEPMCVIGLSMIGKSTLMWATLELIPVLLPKI